MLQHMLSCCRPPFFYFHNACEGHLASALHHRVWAQSSVPYSEQFRQGIVVKKELPNPVQHYVAVVLLACCSSCDAERSISLLNPIVTALRNRMSWKSIRMHLIGAEDLNDVNYPYAEVTSAWGATPRRYTKHKDRKREKRAKVLFDGGSDALAKLDDDSSDFASDCSSADSLVTISSSSSYVSCSSDDSDCD